MRITTDDLNHPEVIALLNEHLDGMHEHSPPESVHALDLEGLRADDVTFWTVWDEDELLGCGAMRELEPQHGEIKSMRTVAKHLRRGVAAALLEHLLAVARARGYERVSLETGSGSAFEPAHALYLRFGFVFCGPFGDYTDDPFSRFMTLPLAP